MNRVFLDTNVIIDLLGRRPLFSYDAEIIATLAEKREFRLFCSTLSMATAYYVLRKQFSEEEVRNIIHKFSMICSFLSLHEHDIIASLPSPFSDFDDALQHSIARQGNCDLIITRNTKDFTKSTIPAIQPSEFISLWKKSS